MKKHLLKLVSICTIMLLAAPAWSLTIGAGSINVGSIDDLVSTPAHGQPANSGDATVLAWVISVLGFDVSFETKDDILGQWEAVDSNPGVYAHPLSTNPQYYLVKTGNVTTSGDRFFLFDNFSEFSWAVVDLSDMGFTSIYNIRGISHISEYNAQVPEPKTLLLLGSGLVGLALLRRKVKA